MSVAPTNVSTFLAGNAAWAANLTASMPEFLPNLSKAQAPPLVWIGCGDSRVPESVILDVLPGQVFTTRNVANQFHDDDDSTKAVLEYGVHHLNASHVVVVGHTNCGGAKAAFDAPKPKDSPVTSTRGQCACAQKPLQAENEAADEGWRWGWGKGKGKGHGIWHKGGKPDKDEDDDEEDGDEDAEADHGSSEDSLHRFLEPLIRLRHQLPSNATIDDLILANVHTTVNRVVNSTTIQNAWDVGQKVCVHGWLYDLATGLLKDLKVSQCN